MAAQPIPSAPRAAVKPRLTPHRHDAPQTAELLCDRYGEGKARKLAGLEQKRARQARSRKEFGFWAAVAAEIELQRRTAPDDREAEQASLAAKIYGEVVGRNFGGQSK